MHYRIIAKTILPDDKGIVPAWYAGRKTGTPRFEADAAQEGVLRYYHFENAKEDKAFLEKSSDLCFDVAIVAFEEDGRMLNVLTEELPQTATIELEQLSALEILYDVQQILTQVIASRNYTDISQDKAHEQTRTALNLILKAISVLNNKKKKLEQD